MRICIPIEFKAEGGGFYFLQLFERYLRDNGWTIIRDVSDEFDVLFTNHWMTPQNKLLRAIRSNPRVRIVQRIDGVAQDYGRDPEADQRQAKVNNLADLTIFQSQYAKFAAREKFSVIRQDGPVFHNPVDVDTFSPVGKKIELNASRQVISVSWSTNPLKGFAQIYSVAIANPDIDFVLCGNFPEAPNLPNLHNLGVMDRAGLAAAYRSCQFLLTFSKNEACPNHVLEALASGLPVLYEKSGAMSELIGDCGASVTVATFRARFEEMAKKLPNLATQARQAALERFHPEKIFPQYLHAIQQTLSRPTHMPAMIRTATAWAAALKP
jgi:glycosyltransferase involved in cell wall biosynthesis